MKDKFTQISLFAGAGGIDSGFRETGKFNIILSNDIKSDAVETYSSNFKAKIIKECCNMLIDPAVYLGSIENIDFDTSLDIDVDVITGGPPCQDFSVVRGPQSERGGIKVNRGKLYAHFIRALIHLRPKVFVFENVPGLITANNGEAYKSIIEDFSSLNIRWNDIKNQVNNGSNIVPTNYQILFSNKVNSAKVGVPQTRRRLIIIGLRKDIADHIWWRVPELQNSIRATLEGNNSFTSKYPLTSIEIFEGQPLSCLQDKYAQVMKEYQGLADEIDGNPMIWGKNLLAQTWKTNFEKITFDIFEDYKMLIGESLTKKEFLRISEEHEQLLREIGYYGRRVEAIESINGARKTSVRVIERMKRIPPDENHEFVRGTPWEVEGKGMSLIYRRLHPLKPSNTVVAYGGGGTWGYHYERNRNTLTNRERARIQTFPDNFEFFGNNSQIRAQIGEAVPPLLSKRIGQIVSKILDAARK